MPPTVHDGYSPSFQRKRNMHTVYLHFDTSPARANQLAEEFQSYISQRHGIVLPRTKATRNTMDAGSILTIVLAAPSVAAVAQGLRTWLSKRNDIKVVFRDDKHTIIGTGMAGQDLPAFFDGAAKMQQAAARSADAANPVDTTSPIDAANTSSTAKPRKNAAGKR